MTLAGSSESTMVPDYFTACTRNRTKEMSGHGNWTPLVSSTRRS